ncbi:YceI family protein [Moritella sp. 5]|uniref:YceI family protein n=1 Tax=Moritella sp. 5 TaxID=2746231 RepID=UPI001BA84A10|nr:YceI family protein [Moritella sp. 5]QUM81992.1 YceI family protein [Moritella sp. 5]
MKKSHPFAYLFALVSFFYLFAFGCALLLISTYVYAVDSFEFDTKSDPHNMLMFQIDHQDYSRSIGFFKKFEGQIELDTENLENSSVEATIDITSLDIAGHEKWGSNTLAVFFKNGKLPTASFRSTKIENNGDGKLIITGNLTLMGVTKSLVLDATLNKTGESQSAGFKAGFSATTQLSRKDFGIIAVPTNGDKVSITIEIEAIKNSSFRK